jgi:hypothetical protein
MYAMIVVRLGAVWGCGAAAVCSCVHSERALVAMRRCSCKLSVSARVRWRAASALVACNSVENSLHYDSNKYAHACLDGVQSVIAAGEVTGGAAVVGAGAGNVLTDASSAHTICILHSANTE